MEGEIDFSQDFDLLGDSEVENLNEEKEELILECKGFVESYKHELKSTLQNEDSIIEINIEKLIEYSAELFEKLVSNSKEVTEILEMSIEELGLAEKSKVIFSNIPEHLLISLKRIRAKYLDEVVAFNVNIKSIGKIFPLITNIRYECPACGSIILVKQNNAKPKAPSSCSCGRRGKFNELSPDVEEFCEVTISEEGEDMKIIFPALFLDKNLLKEGNEVIITGTLRKGIQNGMSFEYKLEPMGIDLINESTLSDNKKDIHRILNYLMKSGREGADDFEEFTAGLFRKKGYSANTTPSSGDYGIDVIAEKDGEKIAIQCKLNNPELKIPNKVVQTTLGSAMSPHNATKAIIFTTSKEATPNAVEQLKTSPIPFEVWTLDRVVNEYNAHYNDVEEAWEFLNELNEKKMPIREEDCEIDMDKISSSSIISEGRKLINFRRYIRDAFYEDAFPIEGLVEKTGFSEKEIESFISKLKGKGDVYEPKEGYLQFL